MISIHAPRVGSDSANSQGSRQPWNFNPRSPCGERRKIIETIKDGKIFQSTLPVWGATFRVRSRRSLPCHFNPRSPCGERPSSAPSTPALLHFNPRSPCGERRLSRRVVERQGNFNPRSPCGERRVPLQLWRMAHHISIHAPRVGSDPKPRDCYSTADNFNPRSPCGERLRAQKWRGCPKYFNPRSPCGERRQQRACHL